MKLLALFAIFAVLAHASANVLPAVYEGPIYEITAIDESEYDKMPSNLAPVRQPRVTCDLLSWTSKWFSFNDSACAAKCLTQRRKGGRCRGGICICRR